MIPRTASKYPGRAVKSQSDDIEAEIIRKRIKQLSDAGDITWLDLSISLDMTTKQVKSLPQEAILASLEAETQRSRDTAAAGSQVTIHEVLGIPPVDLNTEIEGIHVHYVPAFKSLLARRQEQAMINGTVISTSRPSDIDHMKKRIAAAIWSDWKAGIAMTEIDTLIAKFAEKIRIGD